MPKQIGAHHHGVRAWHFRDTILEEYLCAPGRPEILPRHSHAEYQICFNLDEPYEYTYRGERHLVGVGSLTILQPEEVHSGRDLDVRPSVTSFRMMYLPPAALQAVAGEMSGRSAGGPFFESPVLSDSTLSARFLHLHKTLEHGASALEQDSLMVSTLGRLVSRYARRPPSLRPLRPEMGAVRRARAYLEDNLTQNVSLADLAQVAGLSPYYLHRVFRKTVGLPPHVYQLQARVARAKSCLLRGMSAGEAALEVGFSDQSQFTRHFKRVVCVTPGRYRSAHR